MYDHIPDVNTVYYLENLKGETVPLVSVARVPSAFINKLHASCAQTHGFGSEGEVAINSEAFKTIGECVYLKTIIEQKITVLGLPCLRLVMLQFDSKNNSNRKVVLHEECR